MNFLDVNNLKKFKDFWVLEENGITIVFSNAEENRSFNRNTEDGINNLLSLKKDFGVDKIEYLKQIHSDDVLIYRNEIEQFINNEGDAIVTNEKNVAIGAFTADCVPVILVDYDKKVIAAIHSGWKGTFNHISQKAIEKMKSDFGSIPGNIKVYIGPHIRQCCYEVSEELKADFIRKFDDLDEDKLFKGRNLSMELCIENDLLKLGINPGNINSLNLCTHCEEEKKLFSYRASSGTYGRLFSFCYIK